MRRLTLCLLVISLGIAPAVAAGKKCVTISGTGDGINKRIALESSRSAIQTEIARLQAENHITVTETRAWEPDPRPYWRSGVSSDLFFTPDEVTDKVYTICWKGVVSPAVCTSGTEICWPTN